jgi:hypothetical protein
MDHNPTIYLMVAFIAVTTISMFLPRSVTSPGRALQKKFATLGNLAGRTKEEIIELVGYPTAITALTEDDSLLQWQAVGYHVALKFNGDICEGVTHEYTSQ